MYAHFNGIENRIALPASEAYRDTTWTSNIAISLSINVTIMSQFEAPAANVDTVFAGARLDRDWQTKDYLEMLQRPASWFSLTKF